MTWEELKEKATELGFTISSYIDENEVELEYIYIVTTISILKKMGI